LRQPTKRIPTASEWRLMFLALMLAADGLLITRVR
jgi:hypothetical protein